MDPYSTPQKFTYESHNDSIDENSLPIIRNIVGAWEKIRITYNLILAAPAISLFIYANQNSFLTDRQLYKGAILAVLCANLFYFAGPIVEIYLCALSQRPPRKKLRATLLIIGFIFSLSSIALGFKLIIYYQKYVPS